jgi:tRNA (guanine-N7-)-methyltransferase
MQVRRQLIIEPIAVLEEELPRPLDWAELFGNANPMEMEIGCGKGTFITQQAVARPDVNFFGIEWARFFWRYTCDRLRRNGCAANARVIRADAAVFLRDRAPGDSLAAVHVYFPDPWPKARHHKRRLIQPAFLEQVHRVLSPGGRVNIVTDHPDYWAHIEPVVRASPLSAVEYQPPTGAGEGEMVGTNFERKYISEGRSFFAISAVKRDAGAGQHGSDS